MLNGLGNKRRAPSRSIPAHLTTLSVSCLDDQFKAVAIHRGTVTATWERPAATDRPDSFEAGIREAVKQTGYQGQTVSLLLSHPRLTQHPLEVPPAKGAALRKIIQRQAQQNKLFPGEAAWASQALPPGNGTPRILLHLFPALLLNQFTQGCRRNGLHLTAVLPPSTVMHDQLKRLPLNPDEIALLAAECGRSTTVAVGRGDGQLLLARTFPGSWNEDARRVALDLHRTVLFINQLYGISANPTVWLFGAGAQDKCQVMQEQIQLPVKVSPVEDAPFYWATEAVKLAPELCPNFISPNLQKAPQRRVFARVVAFTTALLLCGALGTGVFAHLQARKDRAAITKLSSQIAGLQDKQKNLEQRDAVLAREQQLVDTVLRQRPAPAPAWLLAFLGSAVPSDLVVTNFHVARQKDLWKLSLSGLTQPVAKVPNPPSTAYWVKVLQARLADAPFHIEFVREKAKNTRAAPAGVPAQNWLEQLGRKESGSSAATPSLPRNHFLLEGVMR